MELQSFFIQQRDELCRRGEVLLTPALSYNSQQFNDLIEDDRRQRTSCEPRDDDDRKKHAPGGATAAAGKATSAQVSVNIYDR